MILWMTIAVWQGEGRGEGGTDTYIIFERMVGRFFGNGKLDSWVTLVCIIGIVFSGDERSLQKVT